MRASQNTTPVAESEVFGILISEQEPKLRAFVLATLGGRADAHVRADVDDIVQETFVVAWRKLAQYDRTLPFDRWLRGIAKYQILTHLRSLRTQVRYIRTLPAEEIDAMDCEFAQLDGAAGEDANSDCMDALRRCVQALAPEEQTIIRAAYHENQPCHAIATLLGRTVEAVKKRLQRVRAQLHECVTSKLAAGVRHA